MPLWGRPFAHMGMGGPLSRFGSSLDRLRLPLHIEKAALADDELHRAVEPAMGELAAQVVGIDKPDARAGIAA